jgi:hypothetical protein
VIEADIPTAFLSITSKSVIAERACKMPMVCFSCPGRPSRKTTMERVFMVDVQVAGFRIVYQIGYKYPE